MATIKKRKNRWLATFCGFLIFVFIAISVLQIGSIYSERTWTHYRPDYEKVDIQPILNKAERTDEDYEILYRQTGLTKLGIEGMLTAGKAKQILELQAFFFKDREILLDAYMPFAYMENIAAKAPMAVLEEGDIIVTAASRFSWFRFGHSGLVVDGKQRTTVESISPGTKSRIEPADDFSTRANFIILRPKVDKETKRKIAEFAKTELVGLPYQFTAGVFSPKYAEDGLKSTQCAHLIWYAYKKFGWDLDSNGGAIVTPQDMALSQHVEVVQAYGFNLDKLWSV